MATTGNWVELFRNTLHPDRPTLAFVGLVQPIWAIVPLAEEQGRWIAQYLRRATRDRRRPRCGPRSRLGPQPSSSARHTIQVDFDEWLIDIRAERERGRRRVDMGSQAG